MRPLKFNKISIFQQPLPGFRYGIAEKAQG